MNREVAEKRRLEAKSYIDIASYMNYLLKEMPGLLKLASKPVQI